MNQNLTKCLKDFNSLKLTVFNQYCRSAIFQMIINSINKNTQNSITTVRAEICGN